MGKVRSPDNKKDNKEIAFELYKEKNGKILIKDIAAEIGVSESTVRSWKSRHKWDDKIGATQRKRKCNVADEKRNKRSKKKVTKSSKTKAYNMTKESYPLKARQNNKNAITTGEFETILFDTLDDTEINLVETMPEDKVKLLMQELKLLTVRERRMLKRIDKIRDLSKNEMLLIEQKEIDGEEGGSTEQDYELNLIQIQNIEEALTRVQEKKARAIETLHKFEIDENKLELEIMKFEVTALKDETEAEEEDDGFIDALEGKVKEVWNDD